MQLSNCFRNDEQLRKVFTWLTRIGAGRHFGNIPIAWYQAHQCHCIDILQEMAKDRELKAEQGFIKTLDDKGKWYRVISCNGLFQIADDRARKQA
jgi:hypothetical protein